MLALDILVSLFSIRSTELDFKEKNKIKKRIKYHAWTQDIVLIEFLF